MEDTFIVVSNFQTREDLSGDFYNVSTGLDQGTFVSLMQSFAAARGLDVVNYTEDSVVMTGVIQDVRALAEGTDEAFSYAFVGKETMQDFINQVAKEPTMHLNA